MHIRSCSFLIFDKIKQFRRGLSQFRAAHLPQPVHFDDVVRCACCAKEVALRRERRGGREAASMHSGVAWGCAALACPACPAMPALVAGQGRRCEGARGFVDCLVVRPCYGVPVGT